MTVNAGMNAPGPGYDDYETPRKLFNALDATFHFTVDAAANAKNALMGRYWDERVNGLIAPWKGERVFCNPPYSDIEPWTRKASSREAEVAVLLLPVFTGTDWFHQTILTSVPEVWFVRRRVKFLIGGRPPVNPRTGKPSGPRFASMIVVWRQSPIPPTLLACSWDWPPEPDVVLCR